MRNKLKGSANCKYATCQRKDQAQTTEVITLVSGSSCSDGEVSPEKDSTSLSAKHKCGSNAASAAGFSARTAQPLQDKRKTCCAKDIKIAPIFLRAAQQSKSERSSAGEPKSVHPPHSDGLQRVKGQQLLSTSEVSHLIEEEGPLLATCRGQLSPSVLNIRLEEIQTSNPTFPVQTVFSTLQKKATDRLQHLPSTG